MTPQIICCADKWQYWESKSVYSSEKGKAAVPSFLRKGGKNSHVANAPNRHTGSSRGETDEGYTRY